MRTIAIAFLVVGLAACAPQRQMSLDQVPTTHVYSKSKEDVMNALKFFCTREGFRIVRIEEESGRFVASRMEQASRPEDTRTIVLSVRMVPADSGRTTMESKFAYANLQGTPTRSDEDLLVDFYHRLYDLLKDYLE